MFFSQQRLPVSWLGVCTALIGAAYCGIQAVPTPVEVPCPGTGCLLFQDFAVYGVSLWWAGVVYFAFMTIICLRRAHGASLFLAGLALVADAALLVVMLFTAPCIACLGAAFFMGVLFFVLRRHIHSNAMPAPRPSILFLAWSGLFIGVFVSAGSEQMDPWYMVGSPNMERRIYFSPSCPACRDAASVFADNAAFVPVAERDSDYAAIRHMRDAIANGKSFVEALRETENIAESSVFSLDEALLHLRLLRNKAEVLHLGFDKLPLIMINGMPQSLRPTPAPTPSAPYQRRNDTGLPPELDDINSCGGSNPEPCDDPIR